MQEQIENGLTNYEDLAHVVASQEELERSVVVKEVLDVPVVEDALKPKLRTTLKAQVVEAVDVIAVIRSVGSGVLGVEKGEQIALGIHDGSDALDHRFYERFGQIVGDVPAQDGIEFHISEKEVLAKKMIGVDGRISARVLGFVFGILGREQDVLVINAMSEFGEVRNVGGRRGS